MFISVRNNRNSASPRASIGPELHRQQPRAHCRTGEGEATARRLLNLTPLATEAISSRFLRADAALAAAADATFGPIGRSRA